jgi:hypothetical protein
LSCSEEELCRREKLLCRGGHADCHLWFTNGERSDEKSSKEGRYAAYEAKEQEKLNREHFRENFAFYNSVIKRLKEQISDCLMTQDIGSGRQLLHDPRVHRAFYIKADGGH